MFGHRSSLTNEDVAAAISSAVNQATNAATFMAHIVECKEDKAEIKSTLFTQDADRQRMHAENTEKFNQLNDKINNISWAVMWRVMIALGVMLCASYAALYAIFAHKAGF